MICRQLINWAVTTTWTLSAVVVAADGSPFIESIRNSEIASGAGYVVHVAGDRYRVMILTDDMLSPTSFTLSEKAIRQAKQTARRESLNNRDLTLRRPEGIRDLGSGQAIREEISQSMTELGNDDRSIQEHAVAKLRYFGNLAFDDLVAGLKSENPKVRMWSAVVLEKRIVDGVRPLSESVQTEQVDWVRAAAVQALGNTHHPDAVPVLIETLNDTDFSVVSAAINALESIKDKRASAPLKNFTSSVDQASQLKQHAERACVGIAAEDRSKPWDPKFLTIRQLAIDAGTYAGESFGKAEHDRLLEHIDKSGIASVCIGALGDLHLESAVPSISALKQSSAQSEALAKIATPQAVDELISSLHSQNQWIRIMALNGLSQHGGRWAVPVLIELLDDRSLRHSYPFDKKFSKRFPDMHRAHLALCSRLSAAGYNAEILNWRTRHSYNIDDEISGLKTWWAEHGSDFLEGKDVPDPKIKMVFWRS